MRHVAAAAHLDHSLPGRRRWFAFAAAWPMAVPFVAFISAAFLLMLPFGHHPGFPYNWEPYTLFHVFNFWDHPDFGILEIHGGLMTDSGRSPLVALPIWLGWQVAGIDLMAMRLPLMLISAASVPLLWLVGKRIAGPQVGILAATLLALSPVFLLYGRTATNVAMSLVPALLSFYVLVCLARRPRSWLLLTALQFLLITSAYVYAPIRLLWPLAMGVIALEMVLQPRFRRALIPALALTAVSLPLFLALASWESPLDAVSAYYRARGEQMLALRNDFAKLRSYLGSEIEGDPKLAEAGSGTLLRVKLTDNTTDLLKLLIDQDTRPALTDYWNPHGRLYPRILVPFVLIGLIVCAGRARRCPEYRVLLVLSVGFTLPIVLTTNVHVGRLIFALPLLLLVAAVGFCRVVGRLLRLPRLHQWYPGGAILAGFMLVLAFGWLSWHEQRGPVDPPDTWQWVPVVQAGTPSLRQSATDAALVTTDSIFYEKFHIDLLRLALDDELNFVDLRDGAGAAGKPAGPRIYYGQLLEADRLTNLRGSRCALHYFVTPAALPELSAMLADCPTPPEFSVLPGG